jgi:hypothetical protein
MSYSDGPSALIRQWPVREWDSTRGEHAFSKVKQALRRAQARTDDDLCTATWAAFATITSTDAVGWFAHCGYPARPSTPTQNALEVAGPIESHSGSLEPQLADWRKAFPRR